MNPNDSSPSPLSSPGTVNRRTVLKTGAGLALVVGAGGLLAACATDSSSGTGTAAASASGTPKKGGTLRIGASGGGTSDTLDPHAMTLTTDIARSYMLFNQLVKSADTGESELVLADSITPNADATEWTIKVKQGVQFHDGSPLTAEDILFNFKRILDNKFNAASALGPIDMSKSKTTDANTVVLAFSEPYATLVDNLAVYNFGVVPKNFDPKKPVGTGPFKFESFTPGVESKFVRNENYFKPGLPYLDAIIMTDVADETGQVNGLQSQQFDSVNYLSAASAQALAGGGYQVIKSESGGFVPFEMRTDMAPFDDVRVRQAFRLMVDRPQMLKAVFDGFGLIGNDIASPYDPYYDKSIPQRTQDIAQAKALLEQAGKAGLTVDLYTSTGAGSGAVQMAQVFATQAKDAGVTVNVKEQDPTTYFSNTYKHAPFIQEYWQYLPYAAMAGQAYLPTSPWNATFQNNPEYNALYAELSKTTDKDTTKQITQKMMKIDFENGGQIIPFFLPIVDAWAPNIRGVHKSVTGLSPNGNDFESVWIDS
jgi:peptide/nickel transport system substrate-binding protein